MADLTPLGALEQFERTTGYRIHAITDVEGTVWWRQPVAPPMFECTIGDRCMHIDELASSVIPCSNSAPHRAHRWVQLPGQWRECQGVAASAPSSSEPDCAEGCARQHVHHAKPIRGGATSPSGGGS